MGGGGKGKERSRDAHAQTHRCKDCYLSLSRLITGSYDRTCKLWDTATGEELHSLEGHKNVVYALAFNNPFG